MSTRFEPGAPAECGSVPLCVPELAGREWQYLKECLDTNYVSSVGPFVTRFERCLAEYFGLGAAVATSTGTAALHIALLVAGVRPNDEVVTSALSFIAPANAIRYVGAWPVFMDADPSHWQIDTERVVDFLERDCRWKNGELRNKATGRRVRAVLPVHILGHPVDIDPILHVANKFDLAVIEDATESLGATYRGRLVGQLGDVGCLSFNGNKLITAGGGGMLLTNRTEWADRARYLTTQAKDDPLEFIHREVGFNYRLTNIQAAIGVAQFECLDGFIAAKKRIADRYSTELGAVPGIKTMPEAPWAESVFWLYTILVDANQYGKSSRSLMNDLAAAGVQARPLWQPISRSPAHAPSSQECPVADHLNGVALSLPSSVGLTSDQQARVIDIIATGCQP